MGKGIMVIGAAILDVLARPVSMQVFEKGSHPVEELRLEVGGDAANEAKLRDDIDVMEKEVCSHEG